MLADRTQSHFDIMNSARGTFGHNRCVSHDATPLLYNYLLMNTRPLGMGHAVIRWWGLGGLWNEPQVKKKIKFLLLVGMFKGNIY